MIIIVITIMIMIITIIIIIITKIYNMHIVKHLSMNWRCGQSPGGQTECVNR